ncbi:helix-turn-helix domain-containing protein [Calidifontibacter sp. DB0510]|uniref:citrate synthase (unknown stereospecificity) n=1 Tax=Metallococcus carri TaxID=1656884 RepID=A0A967EET6_9MICO|nr:citrate synthase [Metallococcus carri]NHN55981.1 helix-turn-helix domain-containing protein [Metallococcus carri]NOP37562.1 helix-turn-helix domain-containing protein [Calidifontibacter sp. DB2511S]
MAEQWVTTQEAADLLGVRPQTVYSYVSRGILERVGGSRHNGSAFRRGDVLALRDQRRRSRSGVFEVAVETSITDLEPDGSLLFRGRDASELATSTAYERVAELLWQTGELDWAPTELTLEVAEEVTRLSPPDLPYADRARLAVQLAGLRLKADFPTSAVAAINAAVHSLVVAPGGFDSLRSLNQRDRSVAERFANAVGAQPDWAPVINAALVLLADHELATSTVAARSAASTGAGPFDVILAGMHAMAGPKHGGASRAARQLLDRAAESGCATTANTEPAAGFGHLVYRTTDGRADTLLELIKPLAPVEVELADNLALEMRRRHSLVPNVDLALATLERAAGLKAGTGVALFTIARVAGFTAHALEEQGEPMRFRPRASYIGER